MEKRIMNRYRIITFSAILLVLVALPCCVFAASITETKAAIGKNCVASGDYSTAMGYGTEANKSCSTAMGQSTKASGSSSTAMGYSTTASGGSSTAMGYNTTASGNTSTAMGFFTEGGGESSFAGGEYMQLSANADHTFVWGHATTAQSITTANAFLIFPAGTAGKVGIGTKSPNELLEVGGNGRAFFGDGLGIGRRGLLIEGNRGDFCARLEAYDYFWSSGMPLVINTYGGGNVGIGTGHPSEKLDIAGGNGRVETGYSWLTTSDQRLKNNISTLEGSLDKISRLRGVHFDSKEAGHVNKGDGKHIGVIAQELEKEYPELVVGDEKTGYKAVAYDKLTAVLIEAVKELKTQNEEQKAEIEELRSLIKELKS
jgi:trimeric autotransporter adhesin